MAVQTTALCLHTDDDARAFWACEAVTDLCLTDDNGGPPDGPAWLMWHDDYRPVTHAERDAAEAAGIDCAEIAVWVADYRDGAYHHPDEFMPRLSAWMGHQTIGQIAFTDAFDAKAYEDRIFLEAVR